MVDQGDNSQIEVPDQILGLVAENADDYRTNHKERWMDVFSEEEQRQILQYAETATDQEGKKELYRSILQEVSQHLAGSIDDIPGEAISVCFFGPRGGGKTTLQDILEDQTESLGDQNLQYVQERRDQAKTRLLAPDFGLFTKHLPKYEEIKQQCRDKGLFDGDEEQIHNFAFAHVRPEAHGLAMAVKAWAKEIKAHMIIEELGDADLTDQRIKNNKLDELIVIGVTAAPELVAERLRAKTDESKATIANSIRNFSKPGSGFEARAEIADRAMLISSDNNGFKVIQTWKNGEIAAQDNEAVAKFESYADMTNEQMFQPQNPDQPQADSIGQFGL